MSQNLDDFKREKGKLSAMELHNPTLDDIQEILEQAESVVSE